MRPGKVIMGKLGLDGHDRGARLVSRMLRDAGMEVVYTGLRQTPQQLASAAISEDADVVGLSLLSGPCTPQVAELMELLNQPAGVPPIVVAGGVLTAADVAQLEELGVREVFAVETDETTLVERLRSLIAERRERESREGAAA